MEFTAHAPSPSQKWKVGTQKYTKDDLPWQRSAFTRKTGRWSKLTSADFEQLLHLLLPPKVESQGRRIVILSEFKFSSRAAERKTSKMNATPSPSLLVVIRQLLQKVEGASYPTQDPISIENLKTYLRCRVVELEAEEGFGPPPPEQPERPLSLYRDECWLPRSQRSRAVSLDSQNQDPSVQNRPVPHPQLSFTR